MKISVLVPTFQRTNDLVRCLEALQIQTRPADEIVLIARSIDTNTIDVAKSWAVHLPILLVTVKNSGVVHALNAGLEATTSEIIAITDDDAAPRPDWIARVHEHFESSPNVGGVGGRDWSHNGDIEREQYLVGKVLWFGRIVGNHHLGVGPPRDVDHLKGVNMSFRVAALCGLRFDTRLRGDGAQVWNEMAFCFEVKRRSWRLVYDPAVAVEHYPSIRHDRDQRSVFDDVACENSAFNQYLAICSCMKPCLRRFMAALWQPTVGTRKEPGIFWAFVGYLRRDPISGKRWRCARSGRRMARRALKK